MKIAQFTSWLRHLWTEEPVPPVSFDADAYLAHFYREPDPQVAAASKKRQALLASQWARQQSVAKHVIPPPAGASSITAAWIKNFDGLECDILAGTCIDAVVDHFCGKLIPALPPRETANFNKWRVAHWQDRYAARDELELLAAAKAARKIAAGTSGKGGDVKGGGPKKDSMYLDELASALAESRVDEPRRGPK